MFEEVVFDLLPSDVRGKIDSLDKSDELKYREEIKNILDEMYKGMDKKEREKLVDKVEEAIDEYEAKIAKDRDKTIIQKISIDKGSLEPLNSVEVKGHLLNQFSLDENDGYLRVATTTSYWSREAGIVQSNNVYVLDSDMKLVGELEGLAEDESIYSTRFMGDKLYMVTFKQIDPLFVIDLSNPENPKVLGKLKIPGYSTYLHPYDENHLIGFGYDTKENEWGGVTNAGLKLSLFDISDFENPKEVDTYKIGYQGTSSEAISEHKAFLFDKEKHLLVIPVNEITSDNKDYYYRNVWQGAYVFDVDEKGFDLRGKVEHEDKEDGYYWEYSSSVKRSLFMDNVLYTISSEKIVLSELSSVDEIDSVSIKGKVEQVYPEPYYSYDVRSDEVIIG